MGTSDCSSDQHNLKMSRLLKILKLGEINYSLSLKLQNHIAQLHFNNHTENHDTLLLLEHPPVYTIGIRRQGYTVEDEERLKKTGICYNFSLRIFD